MDKSDNTTVAQLKRELKERYALYDDLKDLHQIVVPPVEKFSKQIKEYTIDNDNTRQIIMKFDESLATKANKTDIIT